MDINEYEFLDGDGLAKLLAELRERTDILYAPKNITNEKLEKLEKGLSITKLAKVEVIK